MQDRQKGFLSYFDPSFNVDRVPAGAYRGCFAGKMAGVLKGMVVGEVLDKRDALLPIIFQVKPDSYEKSEKRKRDLGVTCVKSLRLVNAYATALTPDQVHLLIRSPEVEYVTLDAGLSTTGLVPSGSTFCVQVPTPLAGGLHGRQSIGVAVLDSAIPAQHRLPGGRLKLTLDFTSSDSGNWLGTAGGASGHGGVIADVIVEKAGRSEMAGETSDEVPIVDILALKVVNDQGIGFTSDLIRAIDWVIENRSEFDLKVANLSLAHPAMEDHLRDPLCQAVRRMVVSGITTVTSASGPLTQEDEWDVGSPGTEPSAITVAAALSPIRKYRGEDEEVHPTREPEGHFKPDLRVGGSCSSDSLAAATVTGTVVRMLAVSPSLSPILVKSILLSTACPKNVLGLDEESGRFLNESEALRVAAELANKRGTAA